MAAKKKKSSIGKIILFVVEIIVLVAMIAVLWFVLKATDEEKGVQHITIKEENITVDIAENVQENEVMKGYRNIALFGVDSRSEQLTSGTRSDTIMVASINNETKEVKLVSVYRDTYLNLMYQTSSGKDYYGKCNGAYKNGGGELAIRMLNSNLDLDITDFITIGFEGLRDVIDAIGGVYIDVDSAEIKHLNNYQIMMVEELSAIDESALIPVTETGYQLLNGLQATAYCRIRYTSGGDYKRTERQREVIQACLEVSKTLSTDQLIKICNNVFGEICTSLDISEITSLLKGITQYSIVGDAGFPTKGKITTAEVGSKGDCVLPRDLESNVIWLHEFLFGEVDYKPSSRVSEFSKNIYDQTNSYVK